MLSVDWVSPTGADIVAGRHAAARHGEELALARDRVESGRATPRVAAGEGVGVGNSRVAWHRVVPCAVGCLGGEGLISRVVYRRVAPGQQLNTIHIYEFVRKFSQFI